MRLGHHAGLCLFVLAGWLMPSIQAQHADSLLANDKCGVALAPDREVLGTAAIAAVDESITVVRASGGRQAVSSGSVFEWGELVYVSVEGRARDDEYVLDVSGGARFINEQRTGCAESRYASEQGGYGGIGLQRAKAGHLLLPQSGHHQITITAGVISAKGGPVHVTDQFVLIPPSLAEGTEAKEGLTPKAPDTQIATPQTTSPSPIPPTEEQATSEKPSSLPSKGPKQQPSDDTTKAPSSSAASPSAAPSPWVTLRVELVGSASEEEVASRRAVIERIVLLGVETLPPRTQVKVMEVSGTLKRLTATRRYLPLHRRQLSIWHTTLTLRVTPPSPLASAEERSGLYHSVATFLTSPGLGGFAFAYMSQAGSSVDSVVLLPSADGEGPLPKGAARSAPLPQEAEQVSSSLAAAPVSSENVCVLDAAHNLKLSWGVGARSARMPAYIDMELSSDGEVGWLSAGFVGDARRMVTNPSHKVMVMRGGAGSPQMLGLVGYDAEHAVEAVKMQDYGVLPLLAETGNGKMVMRFRQYLNSSTSSAAPRKLQGQANVLWAYSSSASFPSGHASSGYTIVDLGRGFCITNPPPPHSSLSGFLLLLLPLAAGLVGASPLASASSSFGRLLLHRRLGPIAKLPPALASATCGWLSGLQNLTYGELLVLITYLVVHFALLVQWATWYGDWSAASGYASLTSLLLLFVPVSKAAFAGSGVFGVTSYARAVKFHRFLGVSFLFFTSLHLVIKAARHSASWSSATLFVRSPTGVNVGCGMLAYALFVVGCGAAVFTLLRRKNFELFKSLHLLTVPAALLVVAHAPVAAAPYVLLPLCVGLLDWLYRWHRALRYAAAATLENLPGDMVRVTMKRPTTADALCRPYPRARAGEFFFVCFPGLNAYQWHPLSAAGLAAHEDKDLVFIAKNHGKGSWTDGLATLAEKGCGVLLTQLPPSPSSIYRITIGAGDPIGRYHPVLLDGPYGDVGVDLQWSTRLMLVAGGAGMSVVSALLAHMSAMRRSKDESGKLGVEYLTLVWVVRDPEVILAFAPTLQSLIEELTAAPSVDPVAADPVASDPSSPRPDAQPTSPPPAHSEGPTVKFQVEGREEEEEEEADYENPPMTPSPVRTMRHPVLAATQESTVPSPRGMTLVSPPPPTAQAQRPQSMVPPPSKGPRRMNFSLHVYVTGQEAERANKDDDRPGAPAAAQEEGRPRPLRLNDRPSGRGEIAGIGYETGRPSLPRLCQAFFPSDTEVFKRAAIFTCGPESLMFDAQREATTRGMAFHMEEFRW